MQSPCRLVAFCRAKCRLTMMIHAGLSRGFAVQTTRKTHYAYRRDEILAPTDNGDDVTIAALTVAGRSAQGTDLNL